MIRKPLIIIGDSKFAEIAYEYFTYDSDFDVVGFAVEKAYQTRDSFYQLPVIPFEELEQHFAPESHSFYAALIYNQRNAVRKRLYLAMKQRGYKAASYISSRAFVWKNVSLGDHCFIFEDNTLQPFVSIGNNTVLWSGNHIGHHSQIGQHNFIASHVVISGNCQIGDANFFGVNATIVNDVIIGNECIIGAHAMVRKNVMNQQTIIGSHEVKDQV